MSPSGDNFSLAEKLWGIGKEALTVYVEKWVAEPRERACWEVEEVTSIPGVFVVSPDSMQLSRGHWCVTGQYSRTVDLKWLCV